MFTYVKIVSFTIFLSLMIDVSAFAQTSKQVTLSGFVSEKVTGEVLIGASVKLYKDSSLTKIYKGAISNKFGFYTFPKIDVGTYTVVVTGVTIADEILTLFIPDTLSKDAVTLAIQPLSTTVKLGTVTVDGNKQEKSVSKISTIHITTDLIKRLPALGGEVDVFRVLQLLPGVKPSTELSSGLYVRGGSPDQNLTLLDGVIVYNPSHLGGFLSTFNADAINDIKLIKGAFPAEYGGRLSSVLDISMKEGTKEKFSGTAGISMINSRLTLEGPINEDCTYMISGRRMYFDVIAKAFRVFQSEDVTYPDYYFYDVNAKINYKLGANDRLFLSGYFGKDVFSIVPNTSTDPEFNLSWGNSTANLRWMHVFSPTVFMNTSLIYTNYSSTILIKDNIESIQNRFTFLSESKIEDYMVRSEIQYFPNSEHTIKSGVEAIRHQFISAATDVYNFSNGQFQISRIPIHAFEMSAYIQDEWTITPNLLANIGGRLMYFQKGNYIAPEPRISLKYLLDDSKRLTAAFATAHQFLHLIVRNDITLPTDLWFPSTEVIKPAKSNQIVLGYEQDLLDNEAMLAVEAYYKTMNNLYEYKDSVQFSLGIPLASQFTSGTGLAYGLEVFLQKKIGAVTGWLGYTWSVTERTFPELNNGKPFYPRYDRRHDFSAVAIYRLSSRWEIGATWVYATGQAFTMPVGTYSVRPGSQSYFDSPSRNNYRLPGYHKLDLSFQYEYTWFEQPWIFSINIFNVYNRANAFAHFIDTEYDINTGTSKRVLKQISLFPVIPTFGLQFKF